MDEDLKKKFLQKKLEDILNDNSRFLPTIICERDDMIIQDLIRRNSLVAIKYGGLIPFTSKSIKPYIQEKLDKKYKRYNTNWGEMYIDVNIN